MKKFNSYLFTASNIVIFVLISLSLIGCGSTLSELVKQKNYDEVKINLDEGGDPNKYDKENGFPLIIAVNLSISFVFIFLSLSQFSKSTTHSTRDIL